MNSPTPPVSSSSFRSYLIGTESLLLGCAEVLRARGHQILGIISDEAPIEQWARAKDIPLIDPHSAYGEVLSREPFDYLFSIANLRIIPESVLRLPRKAAINFHDGPLPEYSGLNATSWALLNQEPAHAITWHLIEPRIDAGAIVKQRAVDITDNDTAYTLNTKCFEAGLDSFGELIDELASGTVDSVQQDLSRRRYFGRHKRPPAACTIAWDQDARQISALVRALEFGAFPNPLGLPKMMLGPEVYLVRAVEVLTGRSGEAPGTVTAIEHDRLIVATTTADVALSKIVSATGKPVSLAGLVERYGLAEGVVLPSLTEEEAALLSDRYEAYSKHESFWVRQLAAVEPVQVPYIRHSATPTNGQAYRRQAMAVPEAAALLAAHLDADCSTGEVLAAAFGGYLGRLSGQTRYGLRYGSPAQKEPVAGCEAFFTRPLPWTLEVEGGTEARLLLQALVEQLHMLDAKGTYAHDVFARYPKLRRYVEHEDVSQMDVTVELVRGDIDPDVRPETALTVVIAEDGSACEWVYQPALLSEGDVGRMQKQFERFISHVAQEATVSLKEVALLPEEAYRRLLYAWNETETAYPNDLCIHQAIEQQVARTPNKTAVVAQGHTLTYAALNDRANQLAHYLRKAGVGPEVLVGVCTDRSADLIVCILATLKAGGAYVPLDPDFPKERIAFMMQDARIPVLLTQQPLLTRLPDHEARVICVDADWSEVAREATDNVESGAKPEQLSYVIYTSGSTGRPKGVMVEHRNVLNFFAGMDACIAPDPPGVWLAVTSLSFDISVLELFWTLARGFEVVLYDAEAVQATAPVKTTRRPVDFSLFFFASDEEGESAGEKYRLLLEGARFGDAHGFAAVWTPERHFHAFGGLYPNPSVISAAIAARTEHIGIRAGSCVSPLHSPIRIAEEWAVVDNLSQGRVGISFASGWQPNDFVLKPENFEDRKAIMFRQIEEVQALWRGEAIPYENSRGEVVDVRTLPRPIQRALPVWITAAGNPETFRLAGAKGYHILTHLLGQSVAELTEKIEIYRTARAEHGHDPASGTVTLMLHTFVGEDSDVVRETVREPMKQYLRSSIGLIKQAAWSFPTFKQKTTDANNRFSVQHLTEEEMDEVLDFSFERYYQTSSLFGTVETCLAMVDQLRAVGVDEIACLLDYGVDTDAMLAQLPLLEAVRERINTGVGAAPVAHGESVAGLLKKHRVTHLQCTPTMASMFTADPETLEALGQLDCLMIGGETFPAALAAQLQHTVRGRVINMYGPTETTIWSSTYVLPDTNDSISIGRPIANTTLYVLDRNLQPVPIGAPGELFIGGDGVTRGYLERPELTRERFIPNPFQAASDATVLYRTGDLVRYRDDGNIDFLGRLDHQVKVRGYRIELGEIETLLTRHEGVREAVVVAREDAPGDKRLVGYVIAQPGAKPTGADLRDALRAALPEYMIPSHIVLLESYPLTPNGKVDRKALPAPDLTARDLGVDYVEPQTPTEILIAEIWKDLLGLDRVGAFETFIDLGGHSLLAVQVTARLEEQLGVRLTLNDLLFQSLGQLAATCEEQLHQLEAVQETARLPEPSSRSIKGILFRIKNAVLPNEK